MRQLHRLTLTTLLTIILLCAWPATFTQDAKKDDSASIPPETHSVTQHELTLEGRTIHYTATAETLLVRDNDDKPYGSFFSVAYTENGVTDPKTRPITFVYNGGPGSASFWLHMGSIGPARVFIEGTQAAGAAPYRVVENQYSLLDKTDLVFIDAMGTGFSRPVGKATERDFAGTDQDVRSFRKIHQPLSHRQSALEFPQIPHRGILWNRAQRCVGGCFGEGGDCRQRSRLDLIYLELRNSASRIR